MTMIKEDYAARVPDRAEREEAARLFDAMCAAENAVHDVGRRNRPPFAPEVEAALRDLRRIYAEKSTELRQWFDTEEARIVPDEQSPLDAAAEAACAAYEAAAGDAVLSDVDDIVIRCALSGVPLYDTDHTVEINSKLVLASLVLSPEQIELLTADDEDELEDAA